MSSLDSGGSERYVVVSLSMVPCSPMVMSKSRTLVVASTSRTGSMRSGVSKGYIAAVEMVLGPIEVDVAFRNVDAPKQARPHCRAPQP